MPSTAGAFVIITGLAVGADRVATPRPRALTAAAIVSEALTAVGFAVAIFVSAV